MNRSAVLAHWVARLCISVARSSLGQRRLMMALAERASAGCAAAPVPVMHIRAALGALQRWRVGFVISM